MDAIDAAKAAAEIDKDETVKIKNFPRPLTPAQQIEQLLGGSVSAGKNLSTLGEILAAPETQALLKAREAALAGAATAQDKSLTAAIPVIR